jgi:protease-4
LPVEYVDSIARGRVWTGIDAKKLGLVDELGGLDMALDIAAELAQIDNYSIVAYPKEKDLTECKD